MPEVLSQRALNRALMQRQGLLERSPATALETIERLVGMQAQEPEDPYVGLWTRLADFDPEALSALLADGRAVRAQLMRSTIHLVSARDCLAFHPLTRTILARVFKSPWSTRMGGAELGEVVEAGLELLQERPRSRAELGALLAPRWPDAEPLALAYAVTFNSTLVQVPPRGLWRTSGQARWAPAESFARRASSQPIRRPTSWCSATWPPSGRRRWPTCAPGRGSPACEPWSSACARGCARSATSAAASCSTCRTALLPDPDTPVPPRFLPVYDNVTLSHDDRSRVLAGLGPGPPLPLGARAWGSLLADGFYRAFWKVELGDGAATLTVDRFTSRPEDPPGTLDAIARRGHRAAGVPRARDQRAAGAVRPGAVERGQHLVVVRLGRRLGDDVDDGAVGDR